MRKGFACITVGAILWLVPQVSIAEDVQQQLQQMQDRMSQLEDRLQATNDQLEAANAQVERQQDVIERSGIADGRSASSGIAAFLDTLEIGGWVSGSYWYNFNDPDGEILGAANTAGLTNPFNPTANSFSFDQLWFELERPIDEQNRAGFRADIVFGKSADLLSDFSEDGLSGADQDLEIYQAYVQYLAPIGEGVTLQFGKFATLFGAEVVQAPYNFNVSRGNVYNLLQPITHVGMLASTTFGGGFDVALGVVNENVANVDIDFNNRKSVIGHVGWGNETVSIGLNGLWGGSDGFRGFGADEEADEMILGTLLTWDPSEKFSAWVNANYRTLDFDGLSLAEAWGVAVAGRYALTERLGAALRAEWVDDDGGVFGFGSGSDLTIWSLTGTMDYALTEQLMVRGEVRYDMSEGNCVGCDDIFTSDSSFDGGLPTGSLEDDQLLAGVEVIYLF